MTNFWQEKWNYLSHDQIFTGDVKIFVLWPIFGSKCENICLMTKFSQEKQKNLLHDKFFTDRAKKLANDQILAGKAKKSVTW